MQKYQTHRQSPQTQTPPAHQSPATIRSTVSNYIDCNYQTVGEFLHHIHLEPYLDTFIEEGFDSMTSLLEITEEDMICMNVKRGHRRLIQREIATIKGVPRDQPLMTNLMGPKYPTDFFNTPALKMEDAAKRQTISSNTGYINADMVSTMPNYDTIVTGLTSPRSMNSGVGGSISGCSGNSSSSVLRSRVPPQQSSQQVSAQSQQQIHQPLMQPQRQPGYAPYVHQTQHPISRSQYTDSGISSNSNMSLMMGHNNDELNTKSVDANIDEVNSSNNHNMSANSMSTGNNGSSPILAAALCNGTSSNDDNDSIDTNDSVPTKRKYRRHAKPDRNAPVKPPSAYIMFSNDARAQLKNQNLSFAELAKIVGEQWKNLSHSERQNYERMAMRAKDEYFAALEQYRQTPQYSRYQDYLIDFKAKQEAANRLIGRARKRAKHPSPGSGSIADSSSNGNSNGNGSSGSGSGGDTFGEKESRRQGRSSDEEVIGGQSQHAPEYNSGNSSSSGNNTSQSEPLRHPHYRPTHHHHHHHNHHHVSNAGSSSGSGGGSNNSSNSNQRSSDSGYQTQPFFNQQNNDYRSTQIMRGMLPVDLVDHTLPPQTPHSYSYPSTTQRQQQQQQQHSSNVASNNKPNLTMDASAQRSVSSIEAPGEPMEVSNGEQHQSENEDADMYEEDEVDDEVDEDISPAEARVLSHRSNNKITESNNNDDDINNLDKSGNKVIHQDNHSGSESCDSSSSLRDRTDGSNGKVKRRSPRIAKTKNNTNRNTNTNHNTAAVDNDKTH